MVDATCRLEQTDWLVPLWRLQEYLSAQGFSGRSSVLQVAAETGQICNDNTKCYLPDIIQYDLLTLTHVYPPTTLRGRHYYHPHHTNQGTETQSG